MSVGRFALQGIEPARLDFLPHRGNLCGPEAGVRHLSPTTLTTDEQRLILRATAGNVRDHSIISLALGTGLRLLLRSSDAYPPCHRHFMHTPSRARLMGGGSP